VAALILFQIPLSLLFPAVVLALLRIPVTLPVIMGLILTAGISVNNSILIFNGLGTKPYTIDRLTKIFHERMYSILIASLTTIAADIPLLFTGQAGQGLLGPLSVTIALGIAGSVVLLVVMSPLFAVAEEQG
jgi:HAE1 family hydrophobic/amphiphilic exporter-1